MQVNLNTSMGDCMGILRANIHPPIAWEDLASVFFQLADFPGSWELEDSGLTICLLQPTTLMQPRALTEPPPPKPARHHPCQAMPGSARTSHCIRLKKLSYYESCTPEYVY